MADPWKRYFWRNLTTSYARTVVRLGTGILLFPILYRYFSQEQFGFWSLLWGIMGYTVLVDFGMGFTATLEVARRRIHNDWDGLSRLISTMLWTYVIIFSFVFVTIVSMTPWILDTIHVTGTHRESFGRAFIIFAAVLALAFPLGIFYEVLRGLQRLDIVNLLTMAGQVLNFTVLLVGVVGRWSFDSMVAAGMATTMLGNVAALYWVRKLAPKLSLHPRLFNLKHLKPVLSFSLISYLLTVANLVIARMDQVVISVALGVAVVAIYQVGFKISEIYTLASSQLGNMLSQAAAHCHSSNQRRELVDLMVKSSRLNILVGVPCFALAMVYMDSLIRVLTGFNQVPPVFHTIAYVLLIGRLSYMLTHACACPIFLGGGWERPLLWLTLAEAFANIVLSIVLAQIMGIVGVALGTVIPMVLIGWLWVVPLTLGFTGFTPGEWWRNVYQPVVPAVAKSLIILALAMHIWPVSPGFPLRMVALVAAAVLTPIAIDVVRSIRKGFWVAPAEEPEVA